MKRFPQFPVLGIMNVSSNTPRHRNSSSTRNCSVPLLTLPCTAQGEKRIQRITTAGMRAKESLRAAPAPPSAPPVPCAPSPATAPGQTLLGKERRCLQLPGLGRIPRTQDLLKCCCSSPTAFHYRQVMLFLFPELYLLYFLNSHHRGGKNKEFLVRNDPNSDARQAQQPQLKIVLSNSVRA